MTTNSKIFLTAIFLLGLFLRLYGLSDNIIFHGELGHNYLEMKNYISSQTIPLLGPPTSHPWLSFGPLFYWCFMPILAIVNYNPVSMALIMAIIGSFVIFLNYWTVKRLISRQTALLSSFFISFSPLWVSMSRESRFFSLVLLLFYPFWYFLSRFSKTNNHKDIFLAFFFLGVMLNFHLTPLVYIPVTFYCLTRSFKKKTIFKTSLVSLIGLSMPLTPFLYGSLKEDPEMLLSFASWIPYRIAGFVGLVPKNNASIDIVKANFTSLANFFETSFLATNFWPVSIVVLSLLILGRIYGTKTKEIKAIKLLEYFLIIGYLGIFVHGDPPSHYYLPLFPALIILASDSINRLFKKNSFIWLIVSFLALVNVYIYMFRDWFKKPIVVPYLLQKEVAEMIALDAKSPYYLKRVGYSDEFEGDYAQNYQYLLWINGNEPQIEAGKSYIIYTIYEYRKPEPMGGEVIFDKGGIVVTKNE